MYTIPNKPNSGHLEDFDRHLIVLLSRLGFGTNSIANIASCSRLTVMKAKKAIKNNEGAYAKIWVKMELQGNQRWKDQLFTHDVERRINSLHPSARKEI